MNRTLMSKNAKGRLQAAKRKAKREEMKLKEAQQSDLQPQVIDPAVHNNHHHDGHECHHCSPPDTTQMETSVNDTLSVTDLPKISEIIDELSLGSITNSQDTFDVFIDKKKPNQFVGTIDMLSQ